MQRRKFLSLLGALPMLPYAANVSYAAGNSDYKNVLILVELKGGNDGLNTVIPYTDPNYYALRPRIGIARDKVFSLNEKFGLHPAMQALMPLWSDNRLAVIQGVGYPNPNLSHFRSIEIWDTASKSAEYLHDGWLARAFSQAPVPQGFAANGVVVGSAEMGPLAGGNSRAIALTNIGQFLQQSKLARVGGSSANPALNHILKVEQDIVQAASQLSAQRNFQTEFPKGEFGNAVKAAAQIIANQAGVAAVRMTLNGFDTHQNQPGTQARLLQDLSEGLVALQSALMEINRWDSSLIMTYAEFGRRPRENLNNGTDHGTSNVHFMLGGKVKGGLYGQPPQLDRLDGSGNLTAAVDFRNLYATVLENWWGMPSGAVLGGRFDKVDLLTV
jgi:uncharacterized protein (DUF1501 family)